MLRLKNIELLGFKSFADRTRLVCDGTTAAVVGPNGCGKSNLSDAVSWVLGEQSARMLRGERMSDVIFNGTRTRPPTGMAEVSIVLVEAGDESEGADELEKVIGFAERAGKPATNAGESGGNHTAAVSDRKPAKRRAGDEIKVTRRLFRSGESEYLLNGDICRLRDIQDIFMGTGLGPESYAIIEQGRIGQILSSKPSDRRSIIEEAAGVSKFKARKRLAEAKLESSRQNLLRINDILEEISKQVGSLKRQASKAERYKEVKEELRSRQKLVFTSRLIGLEGECQRLEQALAAINEECSVAAGELETLESERNDAATRYEKAEEDLKRMRETLAGSELESERMRFGLARAREQVSALDARGAESREERSRLERQTAALDEESTRRGQHAAVVHAELNGAQQVVGELVSQQSGLAGRLASAESEVEALRQEMLLAVSRISEIRNEAVKAEEAGLSASRGLARVQAERAEAEKELRNLGLELDGLLAGHDQNTTSLVQLRSSAGEARAAFETGRREVTDLGAKAEKHRQEFAQASARRQALDESLARHAYSTDSVRRLLSASNDSNGFHPLGVLADFLEVSPGYEAVAEELLKSDLNCVVVERLSEAHHGIALLKSAGGRSTFFIRDYPQSGSDGSQDMGGERVREVRGRAGVVAQLSEVVRFDARLGLNGAPPFPALARSFVVEDAAAAQRLAAEFPTCHFITTEGEHYHQRWVSGGKGSSAGPLALRREFRELDRRSQDLEAALAECERRWAESKERLESREEALRSLDAAQNEAEKRLLLASEKLRQTSESAARAEARVSTHGREYALLQAEYEKTGQLIVRLKSELENAIASRERKEMEVGAATESARRLRDELDQMNSSMTAAQVKLGALEERARGAEADEKRAATEAAEARDRFQRLEVESAGWEEEKRRLKAEAESAETALAEAVCSQQSLRKEIEARQEEAQTQRARRDDLAPQTEAARGRLEVLKGKRSEVEVAQARAVSGFEHQVQQCRDELAAEPESLRADCATAELLEGEALQLAEEDIRALKAKLDRLGPVNMMALEELEEATGRLAFLDAQRQDLLASIEDTTATIREIDTASLRKFMDAFNAINGFFAESFRTLFGGGAGEMRFSDPEDPESGIDLVAQPPGKRLQNVLLLSGGEKALTALALLIGVFRFSPSPFCILDEVDAPLDEANVVRFARMIQKMSEQTQFILITHNKRTMETCRVMYGVTMEEPGVSRLVSVRFEARELAPVEVGA